MEFDVVVIAPSRELDEISAGFGGVFVVELWENRFERFIVNEKKRREGEEKGEFGEERQTSTVKGPMEVSRVTSGGPPSSLAHILSVHFFLFFLFFYCRGTESSA